MKTGFALISSIHFFAFVAAQIPIGVVIDRYGPKRCMLVCAVATMASTVLFAGATGFAAMVFARVLMGLGTSCFLMARPDLSARPLRPADRNSARGRRPGGLIATAPLAYASAAIGWRGSIMVVTGATAIVGLPVLALIRNDDDHRPGALPAETLGKALRGAPRSRRCPDVGRLFMLNLTAYSRYVVVVGLWGGPYLTHVYGVNLTER